jgi:diaminopimelate epimerase
MCRIRRKYISFPSRNNLLYWASNDSVGSAAMKTILFFKYQALENDFLVIDVSTAKKRLSDCVRAGLTQNICDRHLGIGADGVIFSDIQDSRFLMRIFNADGSEAEVSGNGLRILAQHLYQKKYAGSRSFVIHSAMGDSQVKIISSKGKSAVSRISLGRPQFALPLIPMNGTTEYFISSPFAVTVGELVGTAVNVGNPHIVFFVDNFDFDWQAFGREVECDERFPARTNVEFAVIKSRKQAIHQSWERGVGVTRASGTGAASTVAAGVINGYLDHDVTVCEPAGDLQISVASLDEDIFLTGPSESVGEGSFTYGGNEKDIR